MAVAAIALKRTFTIILSSSQALTLSGDYSYSVGTCLRLSRPCNRQIRTSRNPTLRHCQLLNKTGRNDRLAALLMEQLAKARSKLLSFLFLK
jgi:hypothetical protein